MKTLGSNVGEQLDLFGDSPSVVDVPAELEDLAIRLSVAGMWSKAASPQSRGLMIGLLTDAGYPEREQQLAILGKLLQYTPCIAAPYKALSSRKAIIQTVVTALNDWMISPYRVKKLAVTRWPAVKALDYIYSGKATMPKKSTGGNHLEETAAYTDLFDL